MVNPREPLPLVLHGDLLDPWCWIAERRVAAAAAEFHGVFATLSHAALPRTWEPRAPSAAERARRLRELRRAAAEPDAPPISPELWSGDGGPLASAPAHLAVAAAHMQGRAASCALREALREAALVRGIDVSRRDVIVEIAARLGLDLGRLLPALDAPGTERALRDEVELACEHGVRCGPALVIDGTWLVAKVRPLRDYSLLLRRYLTSETAPAPLHTVH